MSNCTKCGRMLKDGARFCRFCGEKVVSPQDIDSISRNVTNIIMEEERQPSNQVKEIDLKNDDFKRKKRRTKSSRSKYEIDDGDEEESTLSNLIFIIPVIFATLVIIVCGYFVLNSMADRQTQQVEENAIDDANATSDNEGDSSQSSNDNSSTTSEEKEDDKEDEDDEDKEEEEEEEESSDYILPDSNKKVLTEADIEGLSKEQLRLARNEIYARHHRIFKDETLKEYFESKSWYTGTATDVSESQLSEIEKNNVQFLMEHEN